jgi:ribosome-associated protein
LDWNIILNELSYRTSRSSGAGGQHVNKTETKVEVLFDVGASSGLSQEEKDLIFQKLGARISDEGLLAITSQKERSQLANKEHVIERLEAMLIKALTPPIKRIRTRPTKTSIEDRLQEKKKTSEKKELRRRPKI